MHVYMYICTCTCMCTYTVPPSGNLTITHVLHAFRIVSHAGCTCVGMHATCKNTALVIALWPWDGLVHIFPETQRG